MTAAFNSIKRGLKQAIKHASGDPQAVVIHRPRVIDLKSLRQKCSMTQEQFAAQFGFSTATLRHWERGDRSPRGASLVLLNVIDHNPGAVIAALTAKR